MSSRASDEATTRSFWSQMKSFGGVYWIANWMELVERFAYYGVRMVLPVFMVEATVGPQLTHIQKGTVYAVWALVSSFLPIFSGGFADRYGFKVSIAASTVLKIIGYILMGYSVHIGEAISGMEMLQARAAGSDWTYEIFFVGAMFLAAGTAVFKPGVQGLIATQIPSSSASLGWGLFYQMVNIGGFIGPMVAGYLQVLAWEYIFVVCAIGISLNFVPLFFFRQPPVQKDAGSPRQVVHKAIIGLLQPRLFFFSLLFAPFWLMAYQLFDLLPNFINQWVDSRMVADSLAGIFGSVPTVNDGNLTQAWMINFNGLLISFFAFAVGYVTGKMRSLVAILIGIAISAVAIYSLGLSMNGWWILAAIGLFSFGEMAASPTKMRYVSSLAPKGSEGLYMGYANATVGIGWSIGSSIGGRLYEDGGDKINLAKRHLVDNYNVAASLFEAQGGQPAAVPREGVMQLFQDTVGVDAWQARELLWAQYEPYSMWLLFALIGGAAALSLVIFNRLVRAADKDPNHIFQRRGRELVQGGLVVVMIALGVGWVLLPSIAIYLLSGMFGLLLIASFAVPGDEGQAPRLRPLSTALVIAAATAIAYIIRPQAEVIGSIAVFAVIGLATFCLPERHSQ